MTKTRLTGFEDRLAVCGYLQFTVDIGNLVVDGLLTRDELLSDSRIG